MYFKSTIRAISWWNNKTSTKLQISVVFELRRFLFRLFSYLTTSILSLFYGFASVFVFILHPSIRNLSSSTSPHFLSLSSKTFDFDYLDWNLEYVEEKSQPKLLIYYKSNFIINETHHILHSTFSILAGIKSNQIFINAKVFTQS